MVTAVKWISGIAEQQYWHIGPLTENRIDAITDELHREGYTVTGIDQMVTIDTWREMH